MKATITSLIFLLLSLTVSSQTYKYIGIEERTKQSENIQNSERCSWIYVVPYSCGDRPI